MMVKRTDPTAWVGWIYFAGAMLLAIGSLQIIAGLVAIFRNRFYAVGSNGLIAFNYTAWGWISLILGIVLIFAALGVWAGSAWARVLAVILAVLAMIENLSFASAYPLWSIIALIISGFIIYALTMHGHETGIS